MHSPLMGLSASLVPESDRESRQLLELDLVLVRSRLTDINAKTAKGQHPAATLFCTALRTDDLLTLEASYAMAVLNGKNITPDPPRTELWGLLYAQVRQADGKDYRNILLDDRRLTLSPARAATRWTTPEILAALRNLALPLDSPLSALCVEMMPTLKAFLPKPNASSPLAGATFSNAAPVDDTVRPLSDGLGHYRILRTSPLTEVPAVCCVGCT